MSLYAKAIAMTFKRIFRILELTFIIFVFLIVSIVTFYIVRSNNYDEYYKNLKLGTHLETAEEEWGNPDYSFIYKDTLIILEYNDKLMTDYVLKFDKQSKKLVEKWSGD